MIKFSKPNHLTNHYTKQVGAVLKGPHCNTTKTVPWVPLLEIEKANKVRGPYRIPSRSSVRAALSAPHVTHTVNNGDDDNNDELMMSRTLFNHPAKKVIQHLWLLGKLVG